MGAALDQHRYKREYRSIRTRCGAGAAECSHCVEGTLCVYYCNYVLYTLRGLVCVWLCDNHDNSSDICLAPNLITQDTIFCAANYGRRVEEENAGRRTRTRI